MACLGNAFWCTRAGVFYLWEKAKGHCAFIVPYFIANVYLLVIVGIALMAVAYFIRL